MLLQETISPPMIFGDEPRVRRSDPITSHLAADSTSGSLPYMQSLVLGIFKILGNATDEELGTYYAIQWSSQGWPQAHPDSPRKRRSELTARGLLVDSGERRTNTFGSAETVWVLATAENTAVTK